MSGYGYYGNFIIPVSLATVDDLVAWTGVTPPENVTQVLRGCTSLVLNATEGAYYTIDTTTGLAVDAQVKQAMIDATCIQASAWIALGIDPATGGVITQSVKQSKKIGSASITYADTADAAAARAAAYTGLVPEAMRKLQQNNLLGVGSWTYG